MIDATLGVWVDADACPNSVKEILFKAALRTRTETIFVANQPVRVPAALDRSVPEKNRHSRMRSMQSSRVSGGRADGVRSVAGACQRGNGPTTAWFAGGAGPAHQPAVRFDRRSRANINPARPSATSGSAGGVGTPKAIFVALNSAKSNAV